MKSLKEHNEKRSAIECLESALSLYSSWRKGEHSAEAAILSHEMALLVRKARDKMHDEKPDYFVDVQQS